MRVEGPALLWLERVMLGGGAACLLWAASHSLEARQFQTSALELLRAESARRPDASPAPAALRRGAVIGALAIPRLDLSTVVVEGDDDEMLAVAAGHLPDTPLPWDAGNTAVAAHRDTFFRGLVHVREGDEMSLSTPHGTFTYRVRETLVVRPSDVWVLGNTSQPMLTLVTCYPFDWAGPAPKRFIVRADRVRVGA